MTTSKGTADFRKIPTTPPLNESSAEVYLKKTVVPTTPPLNESVAEVDQGRRRWRGAGVTLCGLLRSQGVVLTVTETCSSVSVMSDDVVCGLECCEWVGDGWVI